VHSEWLKSTRFVLRWFHEAIFHAPVREIFVPNKPVRGVYWKFGSRIMSITGDRYGHLEL
jgi:hypothetical protein